MKQTIFCFILVSILFNCSCTSPAKSRVDKISAKAGNDSVEVKLQLVSNTIAAPVELNVLPDTSHRMLITDNSGKIWMLKNDSVLPEPFLVCNNKLGQRDKKSPLGSIFSIAIHPQFSSNGKLYVCYAATSLLHPATGKLVVSEFTSGGSSKDLANVQSEYRVFELEGENITHNGAQVAFGPDGYLYISIGDDQLGDSQYVYHGQDLNFFNGKLLRIDVNKKPYAIPADNPFATTKNAKPEIWAYGFRKMWRFCFDASTHQLFGADVGQEKEEEIDIVQKGCNYGWPLKEGDSSFLKMDSSNQSIFTPPIYAYTHKEGICVIGGRFYYGKQIPALDKKYVFADFNGNMFALVKNEKGNWVRQPLKISNRPKDPFLICGVNVDDNNELYVMGLLQTKAGVTGLVYKIVKI
ncbi:PQQ-dependent sugar dehydrogenase [Ferruginibacter paludis]|uniref:PQQ-dependent sugar dehydrogenase n=1 Tax=Ferruginibacter paludis TaxID=1310417 RepID=UPI0025B3E89D|nr:PQQ-dependent sugar dehydrogenase [Ferruginibacter paludis]MDN3657256.1 PQQ-dependent sugar dehydrogenase [Ferruginibacter paludis]